jgi:hypothetical protein
MEALVVLPLLVAELIAICLLVLIPTVALAVQLIGWGLFLIGRLLSRRRREAGGARPQLGSSWARRLRTAFLVLLAVTAVGMLLIHVVLFEGTLRTFFARVEAHSGVKVSFDSASGNFLTGHVTVRGLRVARPQSATTRFDLRVARAEADVDMFSLLSEHKTLDSLEVSGISGQVVRVGRRAKRRSQRRRTSFVIRDLVFAQAKVRYENRLQPKRPLATTITLEQLKSRPLRSRRLIHDVLLRSDAKGTVGGRPFAIEQGKASVRWHVDKLPVTALTAFVGGHLRLVRDGSADVDVTIGWPTGAAGGIHSATKLRWKLHFADIHLSPHRRGSLRQRMVWAHVATFVNKHGKHLPIEFELALKQGELGKALAGDGRALMRLVAEAVKRELIRKVREVSAAKKKLLLKKAGEGLKALGAKLFGAGAKPAPVSLPASKDADAQAGATSSRP